MSNSDHSFTINDVEQDIKAFSEFIGRAITPLSICSCKHAAISSPRQMSEDKRKATGKRETTKLPTIQAHTFVIEDGVVKEKASKTLNVAMRRLVPEKSRTKKYTPQGQYQKSFHLL
jgi:hypothetical protein